MNVVLKCTSQNTDFEEDASRKFGTTEPTCFFFRLCNVYISFMYYIYIYIYNKRMKEETQVAKNCPDIPTKRLPQGGLLHILYINYTCLLVE